MRLNFERISTGSYRNVIIASYRNSHIHVLRNNKKIYQEDTYMSN